MRLLLYLVLIVPAASWAAPAGLIATDLSQPTVYCELLLENPDHITEVQDGLETTMFQTDDHKRARLHQVPTKKTMDAFGLTHLTLPELQTLDLVFTREQNTTFLELKVEAAKTTTTVDREPVPNLPALAWRRLEFTPAEFDSAVLTNYRDISRRLTPSDLSETPTGTVLGESPEFGRKYLTVTYLPHSRLALTLGLDVDCDRLHEFSRRTNAPMHIRTESGWLCRVPVITAVTTYGGRGWQGGTL